MTSRKQGKANDPRETVVYGNVYGYTIDTVTPSPNIGSLRQSGSIDFYRCDILKVCYSRKDECA